MDGAARVMHNPPVLRGRSEAEAHVGMTCFKLGPPRLVGAELELLVYHREDPHRRPALDDLAAALGEHAPTSIAPQSPALPLPGGSQVTVEPGGQVELSSSPLPGAAALTRALRHDVETLGDRLAGRNLRAVSAAADPHRAARRLLTLPRYVAMESSFDRVGPYGRLMMANTAATQVSVDAGTPGSQLRSRWSALHEIGPALLAAFACSPRLHGAPAGAWASQRMRTWLHLDPARTSGPALDVADPAEAYAEWALTVPLLCVRSDSGPWTAPVGASFDDWVCGRLDERIHRRPSTADLDLHLSTLFPPVRACGHLEVRYLDAQPGRSWEVPIAVLDALLSSDAVAEQAREVAEPTSTRWRDASRLGLADPTLRDGATGLLELAAEHTVDPGLADTAHRAAERTRAGGAPAVGPQDQP